MSIAKWQFLCTERDAMNSVEIYLNLDGGVFTWFGFFILWDINFQGLFIAKTILVEEQ